MVFQASKFKERKLLELNNDDSSPIYPIYSKDRAWLKHFGFLIYYVLELLHWLQIMYQSVNIGLGSFPKNPLHALAVIILLRQGDIFYSNVHSTECLGVQKESL